MEHDRDGVIDLVCVECEGVVFAEGLGDNPDAEELAEWGELSAECVECGAKYKHLVKSKGKRTYIDVEGRTLEPVRAA